ncbi:hypothetical protein Pcinc_037235 [Petrolisthes cinctipes]|uniref:Uncharacterized protein n=1 Tax=Petrolisthes cinctipes TaxID=88211 RepID=A0AAE1BT75_PETCI|nr:hypothetical protein Pcinc_037235 [Petrolisthes cinctipes]
MAPVMTWMMMMMMMAGGATSYIVHTSQGKDGSLPVNFRNNDLILIRPAYAYTTVSITINNQIPSQYTLPTADALYRVTWNIIWEDGIIYYVVNLFHESYTISSVTSPLLIQSDHPVAWVVCTKSRACDLPEFPPPPPTTTTTTTTTSTTATPTPTTTVAVLTSSPAPFSTDRTCFTVVVVLGVVCGILALTTLTFAVCFCRASRRMTASKVDQAMATAPVLPPGPPPPPPSTAPGSWENYYHYSGNQHSMRKNSEHSSENSLYGAFDGDALSMGHIQ